MNVRHQKIGKRKIWISAGAFLALVVVVCMTVWYFHSVEELKVTEPMYAYVGGSRSDYPEGLTLRHQSETMYVVEGKVKQILPDVMFYCRDRDAVILQESMLWNKKSPEDQKRLDYFSEVRLELGVVCLDNKTAVVQGPQGFLYNGSNTYLLLEDAVLTWNGQSEELSALSCVSAEYGGYLEVYDYGEKNAFADMLADSGAELTFQDGTRVAVVTDKLYLSNGSWYLLLTDPSVLEGIR